MRTNTTAPLKIHFTNVKRETKENSNIPTENQAKTFCPKSATRYVSLTDVSLFKWRANTNIYLYFSIRFNNTLINYFQEADVFLRI